MYNSATVPREESVSSSSGLRGFQPPAHLPTHCCQRITPLQPHSSAPRPLHPSSGSPQGAHTVRESGPDSYSGFRSQTGRRETQAPGNHSPHHPPSLWRRRVTHSNRDPLARIPGTHVQHAQTGTRPFASAFLVPTPTTNGGTRLLLGWVCREHLCCTISRAVRDGEGLLNSPRRVGVLLTLTTPLARRNRCQRPLSLCQLQGYAQTLRRNPPSRRLTPPKGGLPSAAFFSLSVRAV